MKASDAKSNLEKQRITARESGTSTLIVEGGNPGSTYIGKTDYGPDWDASDVSLEIEPYTGGSKFSVAGITVEATHWQSGEPIGIYVEMTLDEAVKLNAELGKIIFDRIKSQGYLDK